MYYLKTSLNTLHNYDKFILFEERLYIIIKRL